MQNTEQWLTDGNCDKCRRKKYCGTPCKRGKNRETMETASIITSAILRAMNDNR